MKIRPVGARLLHADGQPWWGSHSPFTQFCECA